MYRTILLFVILCSIITSCQDKEDSKPQTESSEIGWSALDNSVRNFAGKYERYIIDATNNTSTLDSFYGVKSYELIFIRVDHNTLRINDANSDHPYPVGIQECKLYDETDGELHFSTPKQAGSRNNVSVSYSIEGNHVNTILKTEEKDIGNGMKERILFRLWQEYRW